MLEPEVTGRGSGDVDRTLLRENLKLTAEQSLHKLQDFANAAVASGGAARRRQ